MQDLYSRAKSSVLVNHALTEWFIIAIGLRQGCLLSPDLFSLFLVHILNLALKGSQHGVVINGALVQKICFADDLNVGHTEEAVQDTINSLNETSKRFGMEINEAKTEVLVTSNKIYKSTTSIAINGVKLNQANTFPYLGSTMTVANTSKADIRKRVGMASTAFGRLKSGITRTLT